MKIRVGLESVDHTLLKLMGDYFFCSAGTGKNWALSRRVPNRSPVMDKILARMGPEFLSSTGAGVWRKAPVAFLDSSSALDRFLSANLMLLIQRRFCIGVARLLGDSGCAVSVSVSVIYFVINS